MITKATIDRGHVKISCFFVLDNSVGSTVKTRKFYSDVETVNLHIMNFY